ncbi:MAG: helix-turn-helix domain-containing protein [Lachnospiraceae bacterium]|nr:helix-turn-helix domain-containing protein [Lachnospiraceae bacterium]
MLSHQLLQQALTELSAMIHTDFALFNEKNQSIASTFSLPEDLAATAAAFWDIPSTSQSISAPGGASYHFFKLTEHTGDPLLLIAHGPSTTSYTGGCIASSQIKFLIKAGEEQMSREQFFLRLFTGALTDSERTHRARQLRLSADAPYGLLLISTEHTGSVDFRTILQQLFVETSMDNCVMISDTQFALIRDLSRTSNPQDYLLKTAPVVADTLSMEAMVRFHVSYSSIAGTLADLPRIYHEAALAMEAGKLFFPERQVISYQTLGLGKLICQLPVSLCASFAKDIFGEELPVLDDELLSTINRFFKNSLNISETARQLYLHRNTLVYRLERVQKMTGLDIRNFEDALTFRIAWMAASRIQSIEKKQSLSPIENSSPSV